MARVYVGGLHYNCRERDLERFFKRYGRLRDCLIKNGYGFVVSVLSAVSHMLKSDSIIMNYVFTHIVLQVCRVSYCLYFVKMNVFIESVG